MADVYNKLDLVKVEAKLKDDPSITLLVNNAGCASVAPLLDADIQKMEDMIALDVTAPLAYESGMHPLSLLLAQKFLPIFRWAGCAQLPEHSRKMLLRFEAAGHGDIQNSHVGRPQHLLCALDSMVQDKLVGAFPG